MCVCVCFVFQCIISSSFPQPRVLHFTTVLPFSVFQVYPKKLPFQHSLTLGLLLCCLSLYFAINIVGLLAPIASGIQLVFSPPFQADTQSGKNSRPKSTSFSFFKVLTIIFLIFAAIRTGKSCSKWSLQSVYPKKLTRKHALLAAACLVLLTLKLDCLKMCVFVYQRCVD